MAGCTMMSFRISLFGRAKELVVARIPFLAIHHVVVYGRAEESVRADKRHSHSPTRTVGRPDSREETLCHA